MISDKTLAAFFSALDKIINDGASWNSWKDKHQQILSYAAAESTRDEANLEEFVSWFDGETNPRRVP